MEVTLVRFVTVRKASEMTGYTEDAIRTKLNTGVWPEGLVWKWGPDSVILIDLEGYDKWAKQLGKASLRGRRRSSSISDTKESDIKND